MEMKALIAERTGVEGGSPAAFFKLNPTVDDIPEKFSAEHGGVRLLRMGAIKKGGSGCYCAENAFLRSLAAELLLREQDVLIMDMEAGLEHLSRGTASGVDWLLAVVEPSRQSAETARRIQTLAGEIGLKRIAVVGNKARDEQDRTYLAHAVAPLPVLGVLPYDEELARAERDGRPPALDRPELKREISGLIHALALGAGG
jgi:CO dehydrogenase maturation factor